ncbi:hypothetical protein [Dyadobacter frigoris]|uniref:Uncharacterized protein n=1 Tax=Dyadobacter frigoris TaxID=2576211 RepID=A0A4U6D0E5_9BACT|nr:hypothetical protein [Dyadobacter frigoris]TKT90629.1 hypothetical protein FDK13_20110 [Dyadobacter frigoris]
MPDNEFTKDKKVSIKHLLSQAREITVHGFLGYNTDLPVPTLLHSMVSLGPIVLLSVWILHRAKTGVTQGEVTPLYSNAN